MSAAESLFTLFILHAGFDHERKTLWEVVLPDLQECFLPMGLEVNLVDVHLNNDLDHAYDTRALERHLEEIKSSCHHSVGPFFLVGLLFCIVIFESNFI